MSAIAFLLAHCASTTVIDSKPSGAMLYLDGAYVGNTPYVHEDPKPVLLLATANTLRISEYKLSPHPSFLKATLCC